MNRHHPWLSWPQIREGPLLVACHFCDALQDSPRLREGDAAYCCGCGELLYRNRPHSLARAVSFSSAGLLLMAITHTYPFLTMTSGNLTTKLTLWEAVQVFWGQQERVLAVAVGFFTIFAPLLMLGGLFYVAMPLRQGAALPGAIAVTRWFQKIEPWSMLEVFLLGILVSFSKLGELADLHYEIGLWALVGVVLCTSAALGGIDRLELWDRLEITRQQREASAEGTAAPLPRPSSFTGMPARQSP